MKEKELFSSTGASLRSGKFWCLVKSHNTGVLGFGRACLGGEEGFQIKGDSL